MYKTTNNQKGFTLVELSIVIVIIGLIVAGVVAGQSLVREAQLRSIISEQENIKSSMNSFRLQYGAIPGDMDNAADYWANGCRDSGAIGGASVDDDCNGDGNRQILIAADDTSETYMAWYHLSRANLYPGSFTGLSTNVGTINANIPASKFSGAGITLVYDDNASDATEGDGNNNDGGRNLQRNIILFGGAVASDMANGTILSAAQAFALDQKADDEFPTTGVMVGVGSAGALATNCIDTGATPDAYNLDSTDATPCSVAFAL